MNAHNLTITGSGTHWYVVDATNGLIHARVLSASQARAWIDSALGYQAKPAAPEPRACYRISRGINSQGVTIYTAEYITHNGEVRYLDHAAIIDPVAALVNKLTGRTA